SFPGSRRQCLAQNAPDDYPEVRSHSGRLSASMTLVDADRHAVDRASEVALERYCSVGATLAGLLAISHRAVIEDEDSVAGAGWARAHDYRHTRNWNAERSC